MSTPGLRDVLLVAATELSITRGIAATLASAHAAFEAAKVASTDVIEFNTKSGCLTASLEEGRIVLTFPQEVASVAEPELKGQLLQALQLTDSSAVLWCGRNRSAAVG